jgi:hypothetical protein
MNLDELSFAKHEIKKMKNPKHDTNIIQIISFVRTHIKHHIALGY